MSQENVEIVSRAFEAFSRMDFDAALQDAAPDATVDWSHSRGPNAGVYVGHDAIRRFWTDMTEPFERHTFVSDKFIPHGEHVVVPITGRMTGRAGIEVEVKTATVATVRDGRLVRWTMYQDETEALKAVGGVGDRKESGVADAGSSRGVGSTRSPSVPQREIKMAELAGKRFENADDVRRFVGDMGQVELVDLNGHAVGRGTFKPGWRWSEHVKPIAGTDSCQVDHIGYVVEGRMALKMDDGTEREFGPGDAFHMPPGHDAWIVGDETCVLLDFGGLKGYAQAS